MREQEVRQRDHSAVAAKDLSITAKVARTCASSPFGDLMQLEKIEEIHHGHSN
jgi:hypothetical protein